MEENIAYSPQTPPKGESRLTLWDIRCPVCQHLLHVQRYEGSLNQATGQQFITTRYACPACDLWITTQIPRRMALRHWHGRSPFPDPAPEPEATMPVSSGE